jgi:hypothetical protein
MANSGQDSGSEAKEEIVFAKFEKQCSSIPLVSIIVHSFALGPTSDAQEDY